MAGDFRSKIRKATDRIEVKSIVVLLFGDPGLGKTSLGHTAAEPLHLDYDKGIQRSVGRRDSLQLTSWQDGIDLLESDYIETEGIKSLIFDTVGTMLDNLGMMFLIALSSKNGKPGGGLSLKGYGALKEIFKTLKNLAEAKGVDLIFLCQVKEEKDGDTIKKIPAVTGGSYDILKAAADLMGYMEIVNGKRTLDFNSTERHDGKNSPEFPPFILPNYTDVTWPTYLADIISKTKDHMNKMSEEQQKALEQINAFNTKLVTAQSSEELSAILPDLELLPATQRIQLRNVYDLKFVELWFNEFMKPYKTKDEFNNIVKNINDLPDDYYKRALKIKLMDFAKTVGFIAVKDQGFVDDPAKAKPEEKREEPKIEAKVEPATEAVKA